MYMVVVAQLVRASDCGSEGRRFESDLPPHKRSVSEISETLFLCLMLAFFSFDVSCKQIINT